MKRSERAWRSVLIVDDDRDTREMYCESLRSMGFDPTAASSGRRSAAHGGGDAARRDRHRPAFQRQDGRCRARAPAARGRPDERHSHHHVDRRIVGPRSRSRRSLCLRSLPPEAVSSGRACRRNPRLDRRRVSPGGYNGNVGPHALPKRPPSAKAGPRPERSRTESARSGGSHVSDDDSNDVTAAVRRNENPSAVYGLIVQGE